MLKHSGDSGASTGSSGKGKGTVMQDDVRVNYEEIDHNRMNADNKSHPPAKPLNKTSYAELELSGGSTCGVTGSSGKGRGTVMQDDVCVNYGEIDYNRMNAANKSQQENRRNRLTNYKRDYRDFKKAKQTDIDPHALTQLLHLLIY